MASPWGTIPLSSLFTSYPELILATSCFLFFCIISRTTNFARGLPIRWPIAGHTPYAFLHRDRIHDWCTDVLRNSGCTFIFKCPAGTPYDLLLTCDPANVNHVFNVNFPNYPKGDDFAEMFDFLGDGIFNSDKESWKFQRKKAHHLMAAPKFRSFAAEASRANVEKSLIPLLSHFVEHPNKTFDLQDVFMRFSFDITCILVFGVDPGCLSIGLPNIPFADAMDVAEEVVFYRHTMPKSWWKIMRWMGIGPEKRHAEAVKVLDRVVGKYISKRREESAGRGGGGDLLSSYIDSEAEIGEGGFKEFDKFLRDTTLNLMVAGRDTISSALTWFFYLVAKNPNVEAKILQEVRGKGFTDLGELVYLHAALCESLRLYPPVPFEHKGALKADRWPSGVEVDEKRKLLFCTYAMGRMEGIWGKDCLEFRPERWISETGKVRHEPSYKFFAFNAGPRTCLGKDMAFTQLKVVAAAVIDRFRIRVVHGHVAHPKLSIILHMKGGLMVTVSKRED